MSWLDRMIAFTVQQDGSTVGTQQTINLKNLTASNDTTNNRVDITSPIAVLAIGPLASANITMTTAQSSARVIIATGSFDGAAYDVAYSAGNLFAADDVTAVINLSGTDFNLVYGASSTNILPFGVALVTWSGTGISGVTVHTI